MNMNELKEKARYYVGQAIIGTMIGLCMATVVLLVGLTVYNLCNPKPPRTGWMVAPLYHVVGNTQ
jgi:hypothetical protein